MIIVRDNYFILETENTCLILGVLNTGQIEVLHYGERVGVYNFEPLRAKLTAGVGCSVAYDEQDVNFSLDVVPLAWSESGKGDFRHSPVELVLPDGSFVSDFVFDGYRIVEGFVNAEGLPGAYGDVQDCKTLVITLRDRLFDISLDHFFTVFERTNVISRRCELFNNSSGNVRIRKLMSYMMDITFGPCQLTSFDGGWIKETHAHTRPIDYGICVNDSTTGYSSHRHNPGFIVSSRGCLEDSGRCMGFNLVYSGNHYSAIELSNNDVLRVMGGISPFNFEWPLAQGERFQTPEGFFSFSNMGFNGLSASMHDFINNHIVRGKFKNVERPVVINNWEATFFNFTESKIVKMAKEGQKLGAELFVLDDGWFGDRNSDNAGLGDYNVNKKKLPNGLAGLAKKINSLGMDFGLWVEPEMVNEDSDLYRNHPDWVVAVPGRTPSLGRNQLVLDLANVRVQDYIVKNINDILSSANIVYVKWDMNRHISDAFSKFVPLQGMFYHSYILGLYSVLDRIISKNPDVLFESCASGGNRFDAGMLCFMPQVWASDDTDPIERIKIQEGLSYLYPLSVMASHISSVPNLQTLRKTSLSTRFNVSAFGLLGLELDPSELDKKDKQQLSLFINFYKEKRRTFQFGRFSRFDCFNSDIKEFQVTNFVENRAVDAVYGFFVIRFHASPSFDIVRLKLLDDDGLYSMENLPDGINVRDFGRLINHLSPIKINPNGFLLNEAGKHYRLPSCRESYLAYGSMLKSGIKLKQRFTGTGYNEDIRLLSDFGSELFVIDKVKEGENE